MIVKERWPPEVVMNILQHVAGFYACETKVTVVQRSDHTEQVLPSSVRKKTRKIPISFGDRSVEGSSSIL